MTKTTAQANSMIKVSALVVAGIYLYRRFTEGTAQELKASQTIPPLGRFVVAWGVVFFGLSLAAGGSPAFAGDMAVLVMIAAILANGVQVSKDLNKGLQTGVRHKPVTSQAGHGHEVPGADRKPPFEVRSA